MTIFRLLYGIYQMFCTLESQKREKKKTQVTRCRCIPGSDSAVRGYRTVLHPDAKPVKAALCVRAHTVCAECHC